MTYKVQLKLPFSQGPVTTYETMLIPILQYLQTVRRFFTPQVQSHVAADNVAFGHVIDLTIHVGIDGAGAFNALVLAHPYLHMAVQRIKHGGTISDVDLTASCGPNPDEFDD